MAIIEAEGLTKLYGSRLGLEGLSLSVLEGTTCGFLGPNGAGKSTAIRILLGFLRPTSGTARVFGLHCWRDSRRIKDDVGYLPGDLRLYPWLSARNALEVFGRVRRRDLRQRGWELVDSFGLEPDVKVRSMSRGMRQKLGLILALAHEPRLLVLDEPTASLDPIVQETLRRHLESLAGRGHTIIFSSHTLSEVERLCEKVVILREGRVAADTTLSELKAGARRDVTLRWTEEPADAPPFLEIIERREGRWRCRLSGPPAALIGWLDGKALEDVAIASPDLDEIFRGFYGRPKA